jgi:menaquinone-dependent protoporphyrinogen IX oxidase
MRALVVYESMYGNTHVVADRIAVGLRESVETSVLSVHGVDPLDVARADLIVVGGPTHVHGLPSQRTRVSAAGQAVDEASDLSLEPDAEAPGLREWFESLGPLTGRKAAAFDTRVDMAAMLTGRASKAIAKRMRDRGMDLVAPPESFLVDKHSHLIVGEGVRAEDWGRSLAARVAVNA